MGFLSTFTWYQTPSRVDLKRTVSLLAQNEAELERAASPRTSLDIGERGGIPANLSLERVLKNKTCSPMSLYDFYMYLTHIEYSPENLEFYLWLVFPSLATARLEVNALLRCRDYTARWQRNPPVDEPKDSFSNSEATLTEKSALTTTVKELDLEKDGHESDGASYLADLERGASSACVPRPSDRKTNVVDQVLQKRSLPESLDLRVAVASPAHCRTAKVLPRRSRRSRAS